jgi:hypothetical protein
MRGGARLLEIMIFPMAPNHDERFSQRLRCTLKGQGDTERGTCLPVRCTCLRAGTHRQAQTGPSDLLQRSFKFFHPLFWGLPRYSPWHRTGQCLDLPEAQGTGPAYMNPALIFTAALALGVTGVLMVITGILSIKTRAPRQDIEDIKKGKTEEWEEPKSN